jgi:hypothetical protein
MRSLPPVGYDCLLTGVLADVCGPTRKIFDVDLLGAPNLTRAT